MNKYLLERLRANANYLLVLAENEKQTLHPGLKGRFRELFVHNLLTPWLPPYVACGTGMIIDDENRQRDHTQDDVILYDKMLATPILASGEAPEGVFLYNSVLARIEIKSKVDREEITKFVEASKEIHQLQFTSRTPLSKDSGVYKALNTLFAYSSDLTSDPDNEIKRLINVMKEAHIDDVTSGVISVVCIVGRGLWKINEQNGSRYWARLGSEKPEDAIVWFLACMASSCFDQHRARLAAGLDMGIGQSLDDKLWVRANV